jgi:signal transduction histidine kinase
MNRRKSPFSKHPVERKYLQLVLLAMFVPTIIVTVCVYYIIWQTVAYELAVPELIAESLFPAFKQVNLIICFGIPIVLGFILLVAIRLANRFAGPIYRVEKDLAEMIKTRDFAKTIKIRKRDELHVMVDRINEAIHLARESGKSK